MVLLFSITESAACKGVYLDGYVGTPLNYDTSSSTRDGYLIPSTLGTCIHLLYS